MTTENHIELLAKAGCVYARIAFEAANDYVRNAVFKKHTTRQQLDRRRRLDPQARHPPRQPEHARRPGRHDRGRHRHDRAQHRVQGRPPAGRRCMQPYPMFDINDITREMGYAISAYDDFPVNFQPHRRRSCSSNKREIENLHKLFPLAVRYPWLMPLVPRAIKIKWMDRPLPRLSMLHAEYLVAEQAKHLRARAGPERRRATGPGRLHLPPLDQGRAARLRGRSSSASSRASRAVRHADRRCACRWATSASSRTWTEPGLPARGGRVRRANRELEPVRERRRLVRGVGRVAVPELGLHRRAPAPGFWRASGSAAPARVQVLGEGAVAGADGAAAVERGGALHGRDDALEARAVAPGVGLLAVGAEEEEAVLRALDAVAVDDEARWQRRARHAGGESSAWQPLAEVPAVQ